MYGRRARKRREKGNSGSCMRRIERWFGSWGLAGAEGQNHRDAGFGGTFVVGVGRGVVAALDE